MGEWSGVEGDCAAWRFGCAMHDQHMRCSERRTGERVRLASLSSFGRGPRYMQRLSSCVKGEGLTASPRFCSSHLSSSRIHSSRAIESEVNQGRRGRPRSSQLVLLAPPPLYRLAGSFTRVGFLSHRKREELQQLHSHSHSHPTLISSHWLAPSLVTS